MQRVFDFVFSLVALVLFSPLLMAVSVALLLTGEGEILYRQDRIGLNGNRFRLWKFATMLKNSPNIGTGTITVKNDPRVLPFGAILRKTKINEIPQLVNVLIGDMSLIGPRPLTPQSFSIYSRGIQEVVQTVRPGLSGVGSIIFRDEESILAGANGSVAYYAEYIAPYKGALETWYVGNRSLAVYFSAIALTMWVVLFPRSELPWRIFHGLPMPPDQISLALGMASRTRR